MKLTKDEVLKIYDRVFHYHFQQPHQINNILTVASEIQDAYQAKNADQLRDAEQFEDVGVVIDNGTRQTTTIRRNAAIGMMALGSRLYAMKESK